ncbi:N-acetyltransferase [Devosia pacifica]|uniref:N-acetyltransferase n=1 Tax=Devosia pacifica TaxID=1335967 RepID=A0A918RYS9_9HYPH|nr:GNAT family protein [Devosia pacifica]GHA14430.1 N-acetyltransferase [Devosia pacifica]
MASSILPLETERLTLRAFQRSDLEALRSYHLDPSVQRYTEVNCKDETDLAAALTAMRKQVSLNRPGDTLSLAIALNNTGEVIGQVCLRWADATAGQAEVRFILNPEFVGHGYASEALGSVFDMAFDHYRIHRIFARCDGRNDRSARLLQRLGMRLEAHYREHALFQGEWDEELHFAVLDREWRRSTKVRLFGRTSRVA